MKDVAIVTGLHKLAPVGGRAMSGRDGRRLQRLAQMREDLASSGRSLPGLLPLANLDIDAFDQTARVAWGDFVIPTFDVTPLLGK